MKRILYFIVLLLVFTNCSKDDKQEDKKVPETGRKICQVPPPQFILLVNESSDLYKEFVNKEGKIDKTNISLYKQTDSTKKQYQLGFYSSNTYMAINAPLWFKNDVYTGKTETLYLQNASKTYKIEVNGYMKETECGDVAVINEIRVNGEKIEAPYLAK